MQLLDGALVLSATDLVGFLLCPHLTQLELAAIRGEVERPTRDDPELDVLTRRGEEHEQAHLERLVANGLSVATITTDDHSAEGLRVAQKATLDAMRDGHDVIYQGTFFDGHWLGHADFLHRVDVASDLGPYSYEPEDTKLARRLKASAVLQLCTYADLLSPLQGRAPDTIHALLGNADRQSLRLSDYAAYYRSVRARLDEAVAASPLATYPDPVQHCSVCPSADVCTERRRADDHLSLVAGIRSDQRRKLVAAGIETVVTLAESPDGDGVQGIGSETLERLRLQAHLQVERRKADTIPNELLPTEDNRGLCALPEPDEGDLFLDLEGDPFAESDGLEYLFGVVEVVDGGPRFTPFWAHTRAEEMEAFEAVVDLIVDRRKRHPGMHVYHFAPYEPSALKRLMGIHAAKEDAIDDLLRNEVLVDLYQVVRQSMRVGTESYSLKELEPLYMAPRETIITDAASSIVAYENFLETHDPAILDEIAAYNHDDCVSTWRLRDWLEERRSEVGEKSGTALVRPTPPEAMPGDALSAYLAAVEELVAALTAGVPEDPAEGTDEDQARWLLAQLLGWHRREAKSDWWAYYARREMTQEQLADDPECIAGLEYDGVVDTIKKSHVHRYHFDPDQEHKFGVGGAPVDPATGGSAGTITFLDDVHGIVDLKRGFARQHDHPSALMPGGPYDTKAQQEALLRVAHRVVGRGIDGPGLFRAVRDLLLSRPPRIGGVPGGNPLAGEGESGSDAARRLALMLDSTCLPIQGPPGSGKTWTGARMVAELVRAGKRVGITATSHKAIGKLLEEVMACADGVGIEIAALQKAEDDQACEADGVRLTGSNEEVADALAAGDVDVIAGTAWLFAREELAESVDVLFVDEAGQMSLANVVAVGQAAHNIVLLGDPQQLAQPSKGSHPPGAEVSALEHILANDATMAAERGLFLEHTWRLHPDVCRFVSEVAYEDRLEAVPDCSVQALAGGDVLAPSGLLYVPVEHEGNRTSAPEEAETVARIVTDLLGRRWTDANGVEADLTLNDILIVAPYNAQVACLARHLPEGARVGTVDKFQGQEAPVAIYSMATSSTDQVPRGLGFLFSLNRLNVAVSRAQCLAVLVCSPELFRVNCRTAEQMRLVNALCRYRELATPFDA